jgi:hypothetical protein
MKWYIEKVRICPCSNWSMGFPLIDLHQGALSPSTSRAEIHTLVPRAVPTLSIFDAKRSILCSWVNPHRAKEGCIKESK